MPVRLMLTVLLLCAAIFLSGCFGGRETDDVAYVLVIGVDKTEDGKMKITYQIDIPHGSSESTGGSEKKAGATSWLTNTIVAPSPAESRMLLNSTISRLPNVSHITAIIFGEKMARSGIGNNISFFVRNRDFRETMLLIVVAGTAEDYILHTKPQIEPTIGRFYETFADTYVESSFYLRADLHEFYTRLKNKGGSPFTMYSAVNPMNGTDSPDGVKPTQQSGEPYLPGGIPRSGTTNGTEFIGLALFREDKMVGVLDSNETRAVSILQGKFSHALISVVDPRISDKLVTLAVRNGAKPKITAGFNDGKPVFTVSVFIETEIIGTPSGINYEAAGNQELLEEQVSRLFERDIKAMLNHTQELGCDPVGFGMRLRPKFADDNALKEADLTALYQEADIQVDVKTQIRRTGLIWRTSPQQYE